jgi:hypothetical protein
MSPKRLVRDRPVLALTVLAAALRGVWYLLHAAGARDPLLLGGGDGTAYWALARHLSEHLSFDDPLFLFRPPGYPAAIAAALVVVPGTSAWLAIVVSMVASVATVPLTYALGVGLGARRTVAVAAAAIVAVEQTSVSLAADPLSDALLALLVVGATVLALQALPRPAHALRYAGLSAVAVALALLTKPIGLGFGVILAGILGLGGRRRLGRRGLAAAALILVATAGTYVAWKDSNERNFGVPQFSSQANWNLYFQRGTGIMRRVWHVSPAVAQQRLADQLSVTIGARPDPSRNTYFYAQTTDRRTIDLMGRRAKDIIRAHPLWFLALYPAGAAKLLFDTVESEVPRAPYLVVLLALYLAAGVGLVRLWRSGLRLAATVIAAVPTYITLVTTTAITAASTRLFLPAFPFLAVAAAASVLAPT